MSMRPGARYPRHDTCGALAAIVRTTVADLYEVDDGALLGTARTPLLVEARRVAAQLLFEQGYGESAIGRVLCRDHSTVIHALHCLETRLTPEQWDMIQTARRIVRARIAQQQQKGA